MKPTRELRDETSEFISDHGSYVRVYRDADGSIDEYRTFGRLID